MWKALVTIPLQLVCQLVVPGNNGTGNAQFAVDTQFTDRINISPNYDIKSVKPATALPEGFIAFPEIGVAYKYHTDEVTWNEARKACIENGSSLADVDTSEKMKHALTAKKNDGYGLYVGLHRLFDTSEWSSLKTGLRLSMIPWAPESSHELEERRCMTMWYDARGLAAVDCTMKFRFICEIKLSID